MGCANFGGAAATEAVGCDDGVAGEAEAAAAAAEAAADLVPGAHGSKVWLMAWMVEVRLMNKAAALCSLVPDIVLCFASQRGQLSSMRVFS